ncbi:hypothetical protein [Paenibacillus urinalis]|uniref:hypothetical protein n=1 Tax=Paenibacillus urinalis TaxID=521520 RepID=UPI00196114B6
MKRYLPAGLGGSISECSSIVLGLESFELFLSGILSNPNTNAVASTESFRLLSLGASWLGSALPLFFSWGRAC